LFDLSAGRESEASLVVATAAPGCWDLMCQRARASNPPIDLDELLAKDDGGAHSRYNALVGRMVSFARAAEHASSG
jgi:hypothetical protein